MSNDKKLHLASGGFVHNSPNTGGKLFGVCGGLSNYFSLDPILLRLFFVLLVLLGGSGIGIYLILWVILLLTVGYDEVPKKNC